MVQIFLRKLIICLVLLMAGCQSPASYVQQADVAANTIIAEKQAELAIDSPFSLPQPQQRLRRLLTIEDHATPVASAVLDQEVSLGLVEALEVAAHNSRTYQLNKEEVFRQALALDLERDAFRRSFSGVLSSEWSTDKGSGERVSGLVHRAEAGVQRTFKSGIAFATSIGLDLVQLLTANRVSARGIVADASLTIPLLRGAGREVVTEPLQQAERDVLYALWQFERFRRSFAVQVASDYLLVLERLNQVDTAYDNYQRLVASRQRARRLADAGRLPEIQVDQALQDELRARSRWVSAQQASADRLDQFKLTLGLPTTVKLSLNRAVLDWLAQSAAAETARLSVALPVGLLATALEQRRDLRISHGRVVDSRRAIRVAEDALRSEVTLLARGSDGERRSLATVSNQDARLDPDRGTYSALLSIDLPFERTAERNALRNRWLDLAERQRDVEALTDQVALEVRSAWRGLREARENIDIQSQAVTVAERRVASTDLFLQAGRIQIRDLLEAQDDLVSARNALVEAQVQYRIRSMALARDIGTLEIDPEGRWLEEGITDGRVKD